MQHVENRQQWLWNGANGNAWVQAQQVLDQMFLPIEELLVAAVADSGASHTLDVGCGAGSTTLAIARLPGAQRRSVGIDLSQPLLELAKQRAEQAGSAAQFLHADVQRHDFAGAYFDAIVSRFGVMFFDDPLAAFANLRGAARAGARLCCVVWRSAEDNPFLTAAERAVASVLPDLPTRRQQGPGPFAFADAAQVRQLLLDSGWREPQLQPLDIACRFPEAELFHYLSHIGPVSTALPGLDVAKRAEVYALLGKAFQGYVDDGQVRFTAACWQLSALA
jgi:SAM-dependent methyltransferase